ncbi:MAG: electron transfer flavoprotein subunit beta/FixA family protein [Thermodesulfobacteriota bacterium]|nr:electron transfer flavoprotein subunit beta/FixA family protein [Thermodesulfobacteriota bacterium]
MNIVVCMKQVPDAPSIRIDRQRMTVIREGVDSIINPLDYVALEAALDLSKREGGNVTVITMGPPQSEEALREALAVGADRSVLLTDPAFAGSDTLATSHVLARAISRLDPFPDLVLCGTQTIDSDTGHVGPQIAEELDLPQVGGVNEIHLEDNSLVVKRLSDGFLDTIKVDLPALLTVTHGLCPVRDIPLGALEIAFSREDVVTWGADDLKLNKEEVGFEGSVSRVWKLRPPPPKRKGELVTGSPQTLLDSLIRKLEALSVLDEEDVRRE